MKRTYLILAIVGFILPSIGVAKISWETGNYLLYAQPFQTLQGMFANDISSVFSVDLFFAVGVFLLFSWNETRKYEMGRANTIYVWLLTFLFGLAGGFPLFLYLREKAVENSLSQEKSLQL